MGQSISFSTAKTLVGERHDVLILKMQAWCASVSVGLFVCLCLSVCPFHPLSQKDYNHGHDTMHMLILCGSGGGQTQSHDSN